MAGSDCQPENHSYPVCQIANGAVDPVFMPDVKWIEVKATAVRSGAACGDVVSGDPSQPLLHLEAIVLRRKIPLPSHLSFKCHLVCFSARMIRQATGSFRVRKYKHNRIGYSILASLSDRRVSRWSRDCSAVSRFRHVNLKQSAGRTRNE
jgi:hypothetical protein